MIKRKSFEDGSFKKRRIYRTEHPVAILLKKKIGYALTVRELVKITKKNKFTVRSILAKLMSDGLVVHKSPYFAWK